MLTISIKGELWQPVQVSPASAAFARVPQQSKDDAAMVRKLTIVNNVDGPAKLTGIKVPSDSFKAEVKELEPGKKFELTVSLVPPLKPGPVYGNIEVATGITEMPILKIPVNAFIVADVDVTPNQLALPQARVAALQRQLYVRNNVQTAVKLSDLQCTNSALTLDLRETQPGVAFLITVNIPTEYKPSPGGDTITFKTDRASLPLVTVPITEIPTPGYRPPMATSAPSITPPGTHAQAFRGQTPGAIPVTPKPVVPGAMIPVKQGAK
jgi:hypothetical protein